MSEFDRENRADALYETLLQHRPSIVYYSWRKKFKRLNQNESNQQPGRSVIIP
ncbi:MAG: hypothetical protein QOH96_4257 [Blastocatellia bacterium]|nr:hypothetical protein [Blastocatellia bacterium]